LGGAALFTVPDPVPPAMAFFLTTNLAPPS